MVAIRTLELRLCVKPPTHRASVVKTRPTRPNHSSPAPTKKAMTACTRRRFLTVASTAILISPLTAQANNAQQWTTIRVTDMHCSACAKKIAGKLYKVSGVLEVRADVKKDLAYVVPQKQKTPSPRALWEAVESAGFKIVKMSGPNGDFKKKPQS
jgi:copper chaperone CopZ